MSDGTEKTAKTTKKKTRKKRQSRVIMHDDFPPVCPTCGSNELVDRRNVIEREERFERDGIVYTHAKRFYATCPKCGQTRAVCRRIRR